MELSLNDNAKIQLITQKWAEYASAIYSLELEIEGLEAQEFTALQDQERVDQAIKSLQNQIVHLRQAADRMLDRLNEFETSQEPVPAPATVSDKARRSR